MMHRLREDLLLTVGLLVIMAGMACAPDTGPPVPGPAVDSGSTSDFVTVSGTRLMVDGRPYHFVGANFWYGMNLASPGPGGDRQRLDRELDLLCGLGVTNLRVMAGSEGPDSEPWRVVPALQPAPGVYNPQVLDGLDYLLAAAARRDLHLVLCLNNFWPWSGGMAQYVAWDGGGPIPYPVGPEGDWDAYQDYAARFYSSDGACSAFRRYVTSIVTRVNPHTGLAYRDDPVIMAWELANEPRGMGNAEAFNTWIDETAAFIKSLDPNHLVTTGSEGYTPLPMANGLDFIANHDGPDIDYATVHIWPQNWGWYDPAREEETDPGAIGQALDYLQQHVRLATNLGKPLVLEEFGLARDHGSFDPSSTTHCRDNFFSAMFNMLRAGLINGGPLAGGNFWAWAGDGLPLRPGGFWQAGDPWTGDPPHERQGWYGVYHTDTSTLAVLNRKAELLAIQPSMMPEIFIEYDPFDKMIPLTPAPSLPIMKY